jgi:membrane fusion protein, multidrug efflux system
MSQHPDTFSIERRIFAAEAAPGLDNASLDKASPRGPKFRARPTDLRQPEDEGRRLGTALALSPPKPNGRWTRKLLLIGAGLMALAAASYFGWQYWTVGRFEISTDDAYVQAEEPRVPVPKLRVVSLSPTFAGRDFILWRL